MLRLLVYDGSNVVVVVYRGRKDRSLGASGARLRLSSRHKLNVQRRRLGAAASESHVYSLIESETGTVAVFLRAALRGEP